MRHVGTFALYFALYVSLIGVALSFIAGKYGQQRFLHASRFSMYTALGAVAVASSVLMHALLTHDFSIQYVASFSNKSMPLFYLIGSFWGGQAGSLLFWTSVVAWSSAFCVFVNRRSFQDFMPWVTMICLGVMSGLLMILVFASNPFEGFSLIDDPTKGKGLNPLLQTPKMVMHPPSLLAGLATMTVPYAFAMAALITNNLSNAWVKAARKWILVPWVFLSVGNMLGGMWAYEELGWGGYWAWDPVENAAFFPWLMTSALIHSIMIQERRGMLKRWNVGLMISSFVLTLFGTYITRSGLIQSVHSFAQSEIGDYFLALLITVIIFSLALFAWRWRDLRTKRRLDSPASREAAFIFNNWLLVTMTVVVLYGTMWPKIREGIFGQVLGQTVTIGPPWFNRWMVPLGVLLLLLMGVGTIIPWRKTTMKSFIRHFATPLTVSTALTPALLAMYWYGRGQHLGITPSPPQGSAAVLTAFGIVFATTSMIFDAGRAVRARRLKHEESFTQALFLIFAKQRRRYGGYIVHFGIVCAYLAFAGNALKIEKDVSLNQTESVTVGDYTMTYEGVRSENHVDKTLLMAHVSVQHQGQFIYNMYPGKAVFFAAPNQPTSEIDIRTTPLEDVYVALVTYNPKTNAAVFQIFINPFTWWFWFGGTVLLFGTIICMWPTREDLDQLRWSPGVFGRAFGVAILCMIASAPLALHTLESHTNWGSALRFELIHTAHASHTSAPKHPKEER